MCEFVDSAPLIGDPMALRARFRADSYLFFRGLLPRAAVLDVRADIVATLAACGWLLEGSDPDDARPGPNARAEDTGGEAYFEWYCRLQSLQRFHELAHHPHLLDVVGAVLDDAVLVHPRKIARAGLPSSWGAAPTPSHQDFRLVQGSPDTLTAWVPFGDYPAEHGGLRVLAGSAARGLDTVHLTKGAGGIEVDSEVEGDPGWRSAAFRAGDVLLFHAFTVHGALPNHTDRFRISADYRYQRCADPVSVDSLEPHYRPFVPGYDELCEHWTSRASVAVPPGLTVVTPGDVLDAAMPAPAPRLVPPR